MRAQRYNYFRKEKIASSHYFPAISKKINYSLYLCANKKLFMLFTELPLCDTLLDGLQAMNFSETTPVQEQAIPVILEKKDVIACAQTGTGKTAAFLLPLLNNLQTDAHNENKINAIVMAPTRELAQQIDQQMEGFSYFTPFSSVAVYGGNDGEVWDVQKKGLLSGADVVIATPGRLLSHINLYNIDFSGVKYFILDEADRMLDMGFHDDIMKIEKLLPKERQTVMFSATMPPKIQQLAKSILRNPVDISIAISRPPETILQSAYICHEAQKINIVTHLFKEKAPNKVILFSGSKQKVKEITKILRHMGLSAGEMHSDLDQSQRNHIMHEFKNERVNILVATDIVARGIDIDDITLVINFDVPHDAEDYVHRIGRTARAGDSGMAITFVSPDEQYRFSRIEQFLGKQIYRIPVPLELGETPEYNPVRDNRRGRVSTRSSSKGGMRKGKETGRNGGKSSERPEKTVDSGNPERPEKTEKSGRSKGARRNENSRSERNSQANGAPRSESGSRKNEASHSENSSRKNESHSERGSQQNRTSQSRSEKNPREGQTPRKQVTHRKQQTPQESTSPAANNAPRKRPVVKNSSDPKRASSPQSANVATEQTDKPKKKWKWWPF
jgi:superfamily II DNA/RNA helicase